LSTEGSAPRPRLVQSAGGVRDRQGCRRGCRGGNERSKVGRQRKKECRKKSTGRSERPSKSPTQGHTANGRWKGGAVREWCFRKVLGESREVGASSGSRHPSRSRLAPRTRQTSDPQNFLLVSFLPMHTRPCKKPRAITLDWQTLPRHLGGSSPLPPERSDITNVEKDGNRWTCCDPALRTRSNDHGRFYFGTAT